MSGASFSIRPVALWVENFRGLGGEHSLDLDRDLTVLVGKNATGKSSLLNAVEWCLFGAQVTKKSDSGIAERGDWALAHAGAAGDVCVILELLPMDLADVLVWTFVITWMHLQECLITGALTKPLG